MARKQRPGPRRARTSLGALLGAGLCALLLCAGEDGALRPAEAQDRGPRLIFERRDFDFGALPQGAAPRARFPFRNAGLGRLRITRIRAACGCTTPRLKRRSYDFGEGGTIAVELDTRGRSGFLEKTLAVESNDPREPRLILTVRARITVPPRPILALEPDSIDLGRLEKSPADFAFTLLNPGQKRLDVSLFKAAPALRWREPPPWSLPPGAALLIRGQARFDDQPGAVEATAYLKTNDPNRSLAPLRFHAYRPPAPGPRLELDREALSFGAPAIGESVERSLHLINRGDAPFRLAELQVSPGFQARMDPQRIEAGGEARLTVRLGPIPTGPADEVLRGELALISSRTRARLPLRAYLRPGPARPRLRAEVKASSPEPLTWRLGFLDPPGAAIAATLRLSNDTASPLTIPRTLPAPPGFTLHRMGQAASLLPGASVDLSLSARASDLPELVAVEATLQLGPAPLRIAIRGFLRRRQIRLALPERLELGELAADGARRIAVPLTNLGDESIELRDLSGRGLGPETGLELGPLPAKTIPPGSRLILPLIYRGRPRLGALQASIQIGVADPGRPRRSIAVSGWVVPPAGSRRLRLLFHSDEAGAVEPCGCGGKEQLGGLPRLASAVEAMGEERGRLSVSAGDLAGGAGPLFQRRFQAAAGILGGLGYAAMVPGELDLALGPEVLKKLAREAGLDLVCANLKLRGRPLFAASKLVDRVGLRVALIGLIDPELAAAARVPGLEVADPVASLREALSALEGRHDLAVVLAHTGSDRARRIAEEVSGIDVMVVGHAEDARARGPLVNGARLVAAADAGKRLGLLDLYVNDARVRGEQGRVIPLDGEWPDQAAAAAALRRYRQGLRDLPPPVLPAAEPGERYAGDLACRDCHEDETEVWAASLHAVAMESLEPSASDYDPKCTACHTVGQGRPGGFRRRDLDPKLTHVQCESCHGPGAAHAENPRSQGGDEGVPMPALGGEASCRACHNGEHSPRFRWPEYWRRVAHGPRSRLEFWDGNKNGVLDVDEKVRRKAAIAAEARLTEQRRGGKH